ncbi:MAG TPA: zinc ribbon domain-containing protein, partial [Candidatus Binatia bacterium]|nr:zinc ribbon domain-containing protein [Candidatus Binatia bacterium]
MRCPSRGCENPAGTKFCGECGTPVENRCPLCGFENLPLTKFCRECGTSLEVSGKRQKAPSAPRAGRSGKRSVLFGFRSPLSYTPPHLAERIRAEQAAMSLSRLWEQQGKKKE